MNIYPSLTDRLKTQHHAIENIFATTNAGRLLARPQPNKWNIYDNLAHLGRYQPVFVERINQILLSERPSFGRYVAEEDPEFETWRILNTNALLAQLTIERKDIYDLITSLDGTQLNRVGIHKKFGPLNIIQWTEFFLLHEAHHIFTIFQIAHTAELA